MASQHHTSEYSRLKFGTRGASTRYVPLCIHTPDVYNKLQLRQMSYNDSQVWWLSHRPRDHDSTPQTMHSASTLVYELSSAMEEHLPLVASCSSTQPVQNHVLKTSATHPIKYVPFHPSRINTDLVSVFPQLFHLMLSTSCPLMSYSRRVALGALVTMIWLSLDAAPILLYARYLRRSLSIA